MPEGIDIPVPLSGEGGTRFQQGGWQTDLIEFSTPPAPSSKGTPCVIWWTRANRSWPSPPGSGRSWRGCGPTQVTERELRRLEAERVEALRPEREKIAGWARDTIDGMPSTPDIKDADLIAAMRATVEMVRDSLLDLEASMKG